MYTNVSAPIIPYIVLQQWNIACSSTGMCVSVMQWNIACGYTGMRVSVVLYDDVKNTTELNIWWVHDEKHEETACPEDTLWHA